MQGKSGQNTELNGYGKFLLGYIVHVEDFINHLPDEYYGTSYLINEREIKGFWTSMTWF